MDDPDTCVTSKIWLIQRNDVRNAVNLDAADTITHHELPPFKTSMAIWIIPQKWQPGMSNVLFPSLVRGLGSTATKTPGVCHNRSVRPDFYQTRIVQARNHICTGLWFMIS